MRSVWLMKDIMIDCIPISCKKKDANMAEQKLSIVLDPEISHIKLSEIGKS